MGVRDGNIQGGGMGGVNNGSGVNTGMKPRSRSVVLVGTPGSRRMMMMGGGKGTGGKGDRDVSAPVRL